MSGLRRSRPEEQDATLKRLQEISVARHEGDADEKGHSPRSPRSPKNVDMLPSFGPHVLHKQTSPMGQQHNENFFPPLLKISNLPSSPAIHQFEKNLNSEASVLGDQLTPDSGGNEISPELLAINPNFQHNSRSPSPGRWTPVTTKPTTSLSENSGNSSPCLSPSPKILTDTETGVDWGLKKEHHGKPLSSPSSPSLMLKHFKLFSMAGTDSFRRRGSEPILDTHGGREFKKVQLGVTDRRWEKLRSILVAMKDEPVSVEEMLGSCPQDSLENLQDKINTQEEINCLHREVADLNVILRQKESDLIQLEVEKNCALAYIRRLKSPALEHENETSITSQYHEQGIQGLKEENVSKEEVIEVAAHLLKEVTSQQAYLERLMSVVLTHAPWLLDHMDKSHSISREVLDDEDTVDYSSSINNESDDEVWC